MKSVLLAEDDQKLSALLTATLADEGFAVQAIVTADELQAMVAQTNPPGLIILDRLLGPVDTKTQLPNLRKRWPDVPILVISAINTPAERADLINAGADDYLGKPFLTEEMLARARALTRRARADSRQRKLGRATFDLTSRRLHAGPRFESLPQREFMLLNILSAHPGKVYSRPELLESVWGNSNHSETNLVEATVTNLRKRLAALDCGIEIKNQRNLGYWIEG
jgi:DNA-binding response OmpR family regulator